MSMGEKTFLQRNLRKSVGWTLLVQWMLWVGYSAFSHPDYIGCSNWHGEMSPCSLAEVLFWSIPNVVMLTVVSVGLAFAVPWVWVIGLMALGDSVAPNLAKRAPIIVAGALIAFFAVLVGRSLQLHYDDNKLRRDSDSQKNITIIMPSGKSVIVDPAPQQK